MASGGRTPARRQKNERRNVINPPMGSTATRWGVNALILLGIILALYLGKSIFIPTVIALLLAAMLWPLATWMHSNGIPVLSARTRTGFPWFRPSIARWRPSWGLATLA